MVCFHTNIVMRRANVSLVIKWFYSLYTHNIALSERGRGGKRQTNQANEVRIETLPKRVFQEMT